MLSQPTDRQLVDRALTDYTAKGWRIVSQSDSGFQVAEPKKLSSLGMALFVILPAVFGCVLFLIVPSYGIPVLVIAGIGLLIVLADYAVKKEQLHYITADYLRATAPTWILPSATGGVMCAMCGMSVTVTTKTCPQCKRPLVVSAAVHAGLKQP